MSEDAPETERVSSDLARVLSMMSPAERQELTQLLRQPNTYLAEDMDDLIAILQDLGDD